MPVYVPLDLTTQCVEILAPARYAEKVANDNKNAAAADAAANAKAAAEEALAGLVRKLVPESTPTSSPTFTRYVRNRSHAIFSPFTFVTVHGTGLCRHTRTLSSYSDSLRTRRSRTWRRL